jgi:hypothetical protein
MVCVGDASVDRARSVPPYLDYDRRRSWNVGSPYQWKGS